MVILVGPYSRHLATLLAQQSAYFVRCFIKRATWLRCFTVDFFIPCQRRGYSLSKRRESLYSYRFLKTVLKAPFKTLDYIYLLELTFTLKGVKRFLGFLMKRKKQSNIFLYYNDVETRVIQFLSFCFSFYFPPSCSIFLPITN